MHEKDLDTFSITPIGHVNWEIREVETDKLVSSGSKNNMFLRQFHIGMTIVASRNDYSVDHAAEISNGVNFTYLKHIGASGFNMAISKYSGKITYIDRYIPQCHPQGVVPPGFNPLSEVTYDADACEYSITFRRRFNPGASSREINSLFILKVADNGASVWGSDVLGSVIPSDSDSIGNSSKIFAGLNFPSPIIQTSTQYIDIFYKVTLRGSGNGLAGSYSRAYVRNLNRAFPTIDTASNNTQAANSLAPFQYGGYHGQLVEYNWNYLNLGLNSSSMAGKPAYDYNGYINSGQQVLLPYHLKFMSLRYRQVRTYDINLNRYIRSFTYGTATSTTNIAYNGIGSIINSITTAHGAQIIDWNRIQVDNVCGILPFRNIRGSKVQTIHNHNPSHSTPFSDPQFANGNGQIDVYDISYKIRSPEWFEIEITETGDANSAKYKFRKKNHWGFIGNSYTGLRNCHRIMHLNPEIDGYTSFHSLKNEDVGKRVASPMKNVYLHMVSSTNAIMNPLKTNLNMQSISDTEVVTFDSTGITITELIKGTQQSFDSTVNGTFGFTNLRQVSIYKRSDLDFDLLAACANTGLYRIRCTKSEGDEYFAYQISVANSVTGKAYAVDAGMNGRVYAICDVGLIITDDFASFTILDAASTPSFNIAVLGDTSTPAGLLQLREISYIKVDRSNVSGEMCIVRQFGLATNPTIHYVWYKCSTGQSANGAVMAGRAATDQATSGRSLSSIRQDGIGCSNEGMWVGVFGYGANYASDDMPRTCNKLTFMSATTVVFNTSLADKSSHFTIGVNFANIGGIDHFVFLAPEDSSVGWKTKLSAGANTSVVNAQFINNGSLTPAISYNTKIPMIMWSLHGSVDAYTSTYGEPGQGFLINNDWAGTSLDEIFVGYSARIGDSAFFQQHILLLGDGKTILFCNRKVTCLFDMTKPGKFSESDPYFWSQYGWDGTKWTTGSTNSKTMSSSEVELLPGLTIKATNSGLQGVEFSAGDIFTFGVNEGVLKDDVSQLTFKWASYHSPAKVFTQSGIIAASETYANTVAKMLPRMSSNAIVINPDNSLTAISSQSNGCVFSDQALTGNFEVDITLDRHDTANYTTDISPLYTIGVGAPQPDPVSQHPNQGQHVSNSAYIGITWYKNEVYVSERITPTGTTINTNFKFSKLFTMSTPTDLITIKRVGNTLSILRNGATVFTSTAVCLLPVMNIVMNVGAQHYGAHYGYDATTSSAIDNTSPLGRATLARNPYTYTVKPIVIKSGQSTGVVSIGDKFASTGKYDFKTIAFEDTYNAYGDFTNCADMYVKIDGIPQTIQLVANSTSGQAAINPLAVYFDTECGQLIMPAGSEGKTYEFSGTLISQP